MKPEEQRIAIAKACGFKITRTEYDAGGGIERVWADTPDSWSGKDVRPWLPDFIGDLNTCAEMEKSLTGELEQYNYMNLLNDIANDYGLDELVEPGEYIPNYWETSVTTTFKHITASAAQRAEAFLRAKGLWKEAE